MIPGLHAIFSNLTYYVSLDHPLGLVILFLMGVLTDIGIPLLLSLEIFLLFASYYVGPLSSQVLLIVLMLLLGRESGASILYWISRLIGEPFLIWLEKHFSWLLHGLSKTRQLIVEHTALAVIVVRLTPGFLQIPSVATGSLRLSYRRFIAGVAVSSLIYDFGLVLFGFLANLVLKNAQQELQDYFIIVFILGIIIMWTVLFFRFRHRFDRKSPEK